MPGLFSTASGFKPSWGSRLSGIGAGLQGREYKDPELESYLEQQRLKTLFAERSGETEKEKDLDEERAIRHLTTVEAAKLPQTPLRPGTEFTPRGRARLNELAQTEAKKRLAGGMVSKLLSSLVQSKEAEATLPEAGNVALAKQGLEREEADTGTLLQKAIGMKTKGAMPYSTAMGEAGAKADIAENLEKEGTSQLTTAQTEAALGENLPELGAISERIALGAKTAKSKGEQQRAEAGLELGLPKQAAQGEALEGELKNITTKQDIEDAVANRPKAKELIKNLLDSRSVDALTKARLGTLQLKAMEGELSAKEQGELRSITMGLYRATTQDKLNPGMTLRTPEEQAFLDEIAEAVATSTNR